MSARIRRAVQALSAYVPGEQPSGGGIVKLNTNENPYPPSPRVAERLAHIDPETLRRYPDPMCRPLRGRIGELHGCDAGRVFAGNGSDEVLALCTRAFVERGGSVGYFVPSYSLYPVLADIQEAERRPVELGPDFDWRIPPGYRASLFFLANPNAPTGMLFAKPDVAAFCRRFEGVVVIDEAYADFAGADCLDLALGLDNVLVARTLSKSYSLAGLRLGYAVGAPALVEALVKIKDSYNVDALTQAIGLAALGDPEHMLRNVERIRATRRRLGEELAARLWKVYPSQANFVWVRPAGESAAALFERLKQQRIFVRHFPGPRTGDFVRITVGTDAEVDALLDAIAKGPPP